MTFSWENINGVSPVNIDDWDLGEPNDVEENCVAMKENQKFIDITCDSKRKVTLVCQYDESKSTNILLKPDWGSQK